MRLGVPFIAPRQLGAVESIPGRQFLPSVVWRTGQSGAPPDTVRCGFLSYSGAADRWRFGAVGAPDTVRCPLQTVGPATRHARIARPTVGSPDSPVNFSRTPPTNSRERPFHQSQTGAPDTVRCSTRHYPVHLDWTVFGWTKPSLFQIDFSCFQYLDTIH
jgi:hypothetical protein